MAQMKKFVALLLFCWRFSAGVVATADDNFDYTCFPGISQSAGVTIPRGDIHVEEGSAPFPIYCRMNPNHRYYKELSKRSDSLEFSVAREDYTIKLESTVLNDTTIRVVYEPNNRTRDLISCKINLDVDEKRGICYQNIFVGEKPMPPQNFKCISENWKSLNCTWDEPENPVKTTYALSYIQPGIRGHIFDCPRAGYNGQRLPKNSCFLSLRTNPPFRQALKHYQFVMHMFNPLDKNGTTIPLPVNSYAVVKPGPARDVTLSAIASDQLLLHYKIPVELEHFEPGLRHQIRFKSEYDPEWYTVDTEAMDPHLNEISLSLDGFIPFAQYSVEISLLSTEADPKDMRLWSEPTFVENRTLPQIPGSPPKTALGSFEIVGGLQERRVYVYWQQISDVLKNGPDFQYSVTEVFENGMLRPIVPTNVTKAYAEFPHLSLHNYLVHVTSQNVIGNARETSQVFIPHHDKIRDLKPRSFTKIAYSENLFEVSWIAPVNELEVESYTVFWCKAEDSRDRPYQCGGYLDWTDVPSDVRVANVSLPTDDIYQFAVSANTRTYSSGMIWATCTILHNRVVGKLKTVSIENVETKSMEIKWRLDCSDRVGIVTGYKIMYCPIEDPLDTADCVKGREFSKVTGPADESAFLENLVPWTYYKVGVAVLTRAGESEISEYLLNRTDRGQPGSPPENLELHLLERNKVKATWSPPSLPNAPIEFYQIEMVYLDFLGHRRKETQISSDLGIAFEGLLFNQEYEIRVRACTVTEIGLELCGTDWASRNFKTKIGKSGQMPTPFVQFQNSTELTVEWGHAYHVGGPVDHFELNVTHQRLRRSHIFSVSGIRNQVEINLENMVDELDWTPDCYNSSVSNLYNFTVRAVTFDPDTDNMYEGDWSPVEVTPAYCKSDIPWVIILSVAIPIPIIGMILAIYFCGFCKKIEKESNHWLKVENMVIANTNQIGSDGNKKDANQDLHHIHATKRNSYKRTVSKESSEILLPRDGKRNISGCSETSSATSSSSSGCVSTRSSDMDYADDKKTTEGATTTQNREEQAYVAFVGTANEENGVGGGGQGGYSRMGPGGVWQPRPQSPEDNNSHQIPPMGYSRVGQIKEQDEEEQIEEDLGISDVSPVYKTKTTGYMTFDNARAPPTPENVTIQTNPSNQGYITFAQANKTSQHPMSPATALPPPVSQNEQNQISSTTGGGPPGAYCKVGLNSTGYVPPAFLQQQSNSSNNRRSTADPELSGLKLSLKYNTRDRQQQQQQSMSAAPGYSKVSNMSETSTEQVEEDAVRGNESTYHQIPRNSIVETSTTNRTTTNDIAQNSTSPIPGYVAMPSPKNKGVVDPSLLMSPKNLKVESKDPYSRAVTYAIQGKKSTMV